MSQTKQNAQMAQQEYLTTKEAAALLRVSVRTLWNWRANGWITAYYTPTGRSALYRRLDLEALLEPSLAGVVAWCSEPSDALGDARKLPGFGGQDRLKSGGKGQGNARGSGQEIHATKPNKPVNRAF